MDVGHQVELFRQMFDSNDQRVEYGDDPARVGTPRYRRYENYKGATTIGAARRLGATSQDISLDIQAGALRRL